MGRWGLAKGIAASFMRHNELEDLMRQAQIRKTRKGEDGQNMDHFGPNRVLGRLFYKLPPLPGLRDNAKARSLLQEAVAKGPAHALNAVYLAEVLYNRFSAHEDARNVLRDFLAHPERADQSRAPENALELQELNALARQIGAVR